MLHGAGHAVLHASRRPLLAPRITQTPPRALTDQMYSHTMHLLILMSTTIAAVPLSNSLRDVATSAVHAPQRLHVVEEA